MKPQSHSSATTDLSKAQSESLALWASQIAQQTRLASSTTIGITSGSRQANDRRTVAKMAMTLADALKSVECDSRMLLVQLDVEVQSAIHMARKFEARLRPIAEPTKSPLGRFSQVNVHVPVTAKASETLLELPRILPKWKANFGLILIDLGPINLVPSRAIGRLCDSNYAVLGPDSSASPEWILQHVAWHEESGSAICGTLVSMSPLAA